MHTYHIQAISNIVRILEIQNSPCRLTQVYAEHSEQMKPQPQSYAQYFVLKLLKQMTTSKTQTRNLSNRANGSKPFHFMSLDVGCNEIKNNVSEMCKPMSNVYAINRYV